MSFFERDVRVVTLENWLDWAGGLKNEVFVALPMIQRGSVWKPNQIIELWDSLLQGMPIGCLMLSELAPGTLVRRPGQSKSEPVPLTGGLGLIDGQQRTLALLAAWPVDVEMDRRIWIDFADEPSPGQLLRLRVTTANQPFGFRRDDPSQKLSLDDKRKAQNLYSTGMGELRNGVFHEVPHLESTWPYSPKPVLPVDLEWLIKTWRDVGTEKNNWTSKVHAKVLQIRQQVNHCLQGQKNTLLWPEDILIRKRIEALSNGFYRIFRMEIPLIRVDSSFFDIKEASDSDPLLAVLFKRVGTGGTKLSDADYVYSIIKHIQPKTYDLVESLFDPESDMRTIASLLTPTDLVMSAVRLAVANWQNMEKTFTDRESLGKSDFHRLLRNQGFLAQEFLPLIEKTEGCQSSKIGNYFQDIQRCLHYDAVKNPTGLPKHLLPYLGRPLVQVLLRLAQIGYMKAVSLNRHREDVLRLVMFWIMHVHDAKRASELAYKVIRENLDPIEQAGLPNNICLRIYNRLIEDGCAIRIYDPSALEQCQGLVWSPKNTTLLRSHNRFVPVAEDEDKLKPLYHFYRNWWRPWTNHHPILLWLQRDYVSQFQEDPLAGREEDTPYDFDHILPHNHWGDWRGTSEKNHLDRLPNFAEGELGVAGNGIGNVRVWNSSENRADGATAPRIKLQLTKERLEQEEGVMSAEELLSRSAIPDTSESRSAWINCSGLDGHERSWNYDRVRAFQYAIELRAFTLYCRYFNELMFANWCQDFSQECTS